MWPPSNAPFQVIGETDRRLEIELPAIPTGPESVGEQLRSMSLHGLIAAGLIAAVVASLHYAGAYWAFNLGLLLAGFLIYSLNAVWVGLRVVSLCRNDCPQRLVINQKHLAHIVGTGWASLVDKLPLKHIRSVQPIEQDADEEQPDRADRFAVAVLRWNFSPLLIAADLRRPDAETLARLIFEHCNRHLGHPIASENDTVTAPVSLGSLDADFQSNFNREITRPPPDSKARILDQGETTRIEFPVNRIHKHLSGSAATAIILAFVTTIGWVIFFAAGPGWNRGLAILVALTLLFAFFTLAAWRSRRAMIVVTLGDAALTVTRTRLYRTKVHEVHFDQVRDITFEGDESNASAHCRIDYGPNQKLKLLAGHPEDEVVWLVALLRWATGLNDDPEDQAEN